MTVDHADVKHKLSFFVVPGDTQPLIGRQACERRGLVKVMYMQGNQKQCAEVRRGQLQGMNSGYSDLMKEYGDVFERLGCLPGKHTIVINETAQPVVHPCWNVPFALCGRLKDELDRMERPGVIAKVEEPTDWVSSLVVVMKARGDIRVCMGPQDLIRPNKREHYKMPTCEEMMSRIAGAKCFSKLDYKQGYWQLQLDEPSSYLCTFSLPHGRYRYPRLCLAYPQPPRFTIRLCTRFLSPLMVSPPLLMILLSTEQPKMHMIVAYKRCLEKLPRST